MTIGLKEKVVRTFTDRLVTSMVSHMDEPLRSELYSVEQMKNHSKFLAETHVISRSNSRSNHLLSRFVENELVLNRARDILGEAIVAKSRISPAADWLLDNFYLIEEHIYTSKRDLPKGYNRGLPRLASGQSSGQIGRAHV